VRPATEHSIFAVRAVRASARDTAVDFATRIGGYFAHRGLFTPAHDSSTQVIATRNVFAATLALAIAAHAQDATVIVLDRGAIEFPEPFSRVMDAAELPDGRLMLIDSRERELRLVDYARGRVAAAARQGRGPLEYQLPGTLLDGGSDTLTYFDHQQRRFLKFASDGRPVATTMYGASTPVGIATQMDPVAIDVRGRIYGQTTGFRIPPGGRPGSEPPSYADTVELQRLDPGTAQPATIAVIRNRLARTESITQNANGLVVRAPVPDFSADDAWTVLRNGRVALLKGGEYRVTFFMPDSRQPTKGPVLTYPLIPVTAADREAVIDSVKRELTRITDAMTRSAAQAAGFTGAPRAATPQRIQPEPVEPKVWSAHKQPYLSIRASPDDRLWVRTPTAFGERAERYDVLDDSGTRLARVRLAEGERLIALGRGSAYTIRSDADGLQYLRRYPLPMPISRAQAATPRGAGAAT
jgi:hypothetical protein